MLKTKKLKLKGFNNLTKCLSFNLYDFCCARNDYELETYQDYITDKFSAQNITNTLKNICKIIDANILNISDQDYEPWGASSMVLLSDILNSTTVKKTPDVNIHLDKSHICAHTYPDIDKENGICSFRIDIDIATCGEISPLKALNYMFSAFASDVVIIDYVVRGYTRDEHNKRVFIDHPMHTIQDYIDSAILKDYQCIDLSLSSEKIWQTKMLRTNLDISEYFLENVELDSSITKSFIAKVKREMHGIVQMRPD